MKKIIALSLALVIVLSIIGSCLAAPHTHSYVITQIIEYRVGTRTGSHVQGCHACTYAHDHKVPLLRMKMVFTCSCGDTTSLLSNIYDGAEYCPYSPNT